MQTVRRIINDKGEVEFVPLSPTQLFEAQQAVRNFGTRILNAAGDVNTNTTGIQYIIDTLTYIQTRYVTQKFYEVTPSDYMPIEIGVGGWSDTIITNREFSSGGDFEDGIIQTGNGNGQMASVDAGIAPKSMGVTMWGKKITYNLDEIAQAVFANNWDPLVARERARKKNYDLGMQAIAFLGSKVDPDKTPGLLTNADINTNVTTITQFISLMDATELQTFVGTVLGDYAENCQYTAMPDTFIMPMRDYLGMGTAPSATFPIGDSKLGYLLRVFKEMTGNGGFQIKGLAYADAAKNADYGVNKETYMLYRSNDRDTLRMDVPLPYSTLAAGTADNYNWQSIARSRYTGVGVYRPLELLKFQHDPAS